MVWWNLQRRWVDEMDEGIPELRDGSEWIEV
jgi:hypothetical protein